jgi:hypothetical protein
MESALLIKMLNVQQNMNERNFLLSTIAYNAAPTLLHNKPSSLISFTKGKRNLYDAWETYNEDVCKTLGIESYELIKTSDRILVLFYNHACLRETLRSRQNAGFLESSGYSVEMNVHEALTRLEERMQQDFPHEIGVFLGYPIEDVLGFIEKNGKEYLLCKYWKVYHNPDKAKRLFDSYDRARMKVLNSLYSSEGALALQ